MFNYKETKKEQRNNFPRSVSDLEAFTIELCPLYEDEKEKPLMLLISQRCYNAQKWIGINTRPGAEALLINDADQKLLYEILKEKFEK